MIDPLGNEQMFGMLKASMDAASLKHQVHSSNLANLDTPGFKARRLDFNAVLQEYEAQEAMIPDHPANAPQGMAQPEALNFKDFITERSTGHLTERFDGNNVDLDEEVAAMAMARGRYKLASMFMTRKGRLINEVLTSR